MRILKNLILRNLILRGLALNITLLEFYRLRSAFDCDVRTVFGGLRHLPPKLAAIHLFAAVPSGPLRSPVGEENASSLIDKHGRRRVFSERLKPGIALPQGVCYSALVKAVDG